MTGADGEQSPPSMRIGTAERNAAMKALDTHLEAGRLDAVEYGERSARVAEARTADEVEPLFADLPEPHPDLPGVGGASSSGGSAAGVATRPSATPATGSSSAMEVWGPRIAAVMPFVAVVLFFAVPWANSWVFFLLVPAAGVLFAGSRDADGDGETHREAQRRRRDEHRRHHHEDRRRDPPRN